MLRFTSLVLQQFVTIKTDADGSFVYNFDKELTMDSMKYMLLSQTMLEKLLPKVILSHSLKEAQAFTPVDAASSEVVTGDLVTQSTKKFIRGSGWNGILALGLISIMFGITLRPKKDGVVKDDDEEIYIDPTLTSRFTTD